jgi:hypothetical protein
MKDASKMRHSEKSMIRGVREYRTNMTAHDSDFKIIFGLDPKKKWPAEGMPEREAQGFKMYVMSIADARKKYPGKNRPHRVRVICPVCSKDMSAGRLHQHQH